MNLLKWFIDWVANNEEKLSSQEQEELGTLIRRIEIELQKSSDCLIRSKKHQQQSSESSQPHNENDSSHNTLSSDHKIEMETEMPIAEEHNTFLALVKIYLKDVRQINSPFQIVNANPSFISKQGSQLDDDFDEKNKLACRNQLDLDLGYKSCTSTSGERNGNRMDSSSDTSPVQTNCLDRRTRMSYRKGTSATSVAVESFKKLSHIRQDLKKLVSKLVTLDKNTDADTVMHLSDELNRTRIKLDDIECEGNEFMDAVREELIEYTQQLIARLETIIPSSNVTSDQSFPDFDNLPINHSMVRIQEVQKIAERVNEDMKLYIFDSRNDKCFINLDEKLTKCLIQLDCIQCRGDESLLAARKKVVKYIEEQICRLEIKLLFDSFLTNNIEDPFYVVTKNETLQHIREVESLAKNVEYLMSFNTPGSNVDGNFLIFQKMFCKCLIQLNNIECQGDKELLHEQEEVRDYINKLIINLDNVFNNDLTTIEPCGMQMSNSQTIVAKSLESIKEVEMESERLKYHINFGSFESRTDRFYIHVEEMLTKLLISLDSISCDGNEQLRTARKKAVLYINQLSENLEAKVSS